MTFEHGMIVRVEYPPIIQAIDAKFNVVGKAILYAWGDTIYNPMGVAIPKQLMVHEWVHGDRQEKTEGRVEAWWKRYIEDAEFRLNEEIPAHQMEYMAYRNLQKDRNARAIYMQRVARKLASPLYGSLIAYKDAMKLLEKIK